MVSSGLASVTRDWWHLRFLSSIYVYLSTKKKRSRAWRRPFRPRTIARKTAASDCALGPHVLTWLLSIAPSITKLVFRACYYEGEKKNPIQLLKWIELNFYVIGQKLLVKKWRTKNPFFLQGVGLEAIFSKKCGRSTRLFRSNKWKYTKSQKDLPPSHLLGFIAH